MRVRDQKYWNFDSLDLWTLNSSRFFYNPHSWITFRCHWAGCSNHSVCQFCFSSAHRLLLFGFDSWFVVYLDSFELTLNTFATSFTNSNFAHLNRWDLTLLNAVKALKLASWTRAGDPQTAVQLQLIKTAEISLELMTFSFSLNSPDSLCVIWIFEKNVRLTHAARLCNTSVTSINVNINVIIVFIYEDYESLT